MTIIIDAPAAIEAAILRKAERAGLSVSEYALRALLEKTAVLDGDGGPVEVMDDVEVTDEDEAWDQAKREARARLDTRRAAGAFADLSVEAFLAERADDLRLEEEQEWRRSKDPAHMNAETL